MITKAVSLFAFILLISFNASAQEASRRAPQAPGKDILLTIVHNADKTFGYKVTDHGTTAFELTVAPGSNTGYATIQEAVAAADRLQKLLQSETKNPAQLSQEEMAALVTKSNAPATQN